MEVESFESEEVAKLMNDHFVNIKVCTQSQLLIKLWISELQFYLLHDVSPSGIFPFLWRLPEAYLMVVLMVM